MRSRAEGTGGTEPRRQSAGTIQPIAGRRAEGPSPRSAFREGREGSVLTNFPAATLPDLDDSILFVELEGGHVGFWLSTYSLDDETVRELQTALDARVEQALGADA